MTNRIIPLSTRHRPYFICAPSYTRFSAGIKALHLLCHHLNMRGYPAYLINNTLDNNHEMIVCPGLCTPVLTPSILSSYELAGLEPIFVYSDVVNGNPYHARSPVRYLLHYAGALGGDAVFPDSDLVFSYTKTVAEKSNQPIDNILFMPVIDTTVFKLSESPKKRSGSCFYASKYQRFHGSALMDITANSIEITRSQRGSQTPIEIAALFQTCEVFYSYEDTSLATEAILCGCPVVFIPNDFMTSMPLATQELGTDGFAFGLDPDDLRHAKQTVSRAREKFLAACDNYWDQLADFVDKTQRHGEFVADVTDIGLVDAIDLGLCLTGCLITLPDGRDGVVGEFRRLRHQARIQVLDSVGAILEHIVVDDFEIFLRALFKLSGRKYYDLNTKISIGVRRSFFRQLPIQLSFRGKLRQWHLRKQYPNLMLG